MTIARMWESRLVPDHATAFVEHLAAVAWPALRAAPGFVGGEAYRSSDGELRAVLVTRWTDAASAAAAVEVEGGLAAYCARDPHAWQFEQLDL
jgi:quinol monooxygenase YgiN